MIMTSMETGFEYTNNKIQIECLTSYFNTSSFFCPSAVNASTIQGEKIMWFDIHLRCYLVCIYTVSLQEDLLKASGSTKEKQVKDFQETLQLPR